MAKEGEIAVVEHKNFYEALAAFQGENPRLERTKHVNFKTKVGDLVDFWYAPLDEVLQVIRPLLAKHGLSFVHIEQGEPSSTGNRSMVCKVFHTTYTREKIGDREVSKSNGTDTTTSSEPIFEEKNTISSMPLVVKRTGDMKDVGGESTYARRYTLGEVLGIAPDEDNDAGGERERTEVVEKTAFKLAKDRVIGAKDHKLLTEQVVFFEKELKLLDEKKTTSLGFKKEQYDELMKAAAKRRTELGVPKPAPGENDDEGGKKTID